MANFEEKVSYSLFTALLFSPLLLAAFSKRIWLRLIGLVSTAALALWIAAILFL